MTIKTVCDGGCGAEEKGDRPEGWTTMSLASAGSHGYGHFCPACANMLPKIEMVDYGELQMANTTGPALPREEKDR